MTEKSLNIRGVEWRYVTGGRGEQTVLMFHGAVGGAETMRWLAESFADEYRTIAPTVADVRTLDEVCDAVSAILDREHVGRAAVFGGSFGGLVAQAFLKRRPRQVEHLVLLSTGVPNRAVGARTERMMKFLRLLPFPLSRALLKLEISKHLNTPAPPEMAALIVESDDDPMIPPEERRRLREAYPRALVCTFAGAGHLIPLLRLEELVGVVKAFLKEDYSSPADIFDGCAAAEGPAARAGD